MKEIWYFWKNVYKVYTENYQDVKKIMSWKDVELSSAYYQNSKSFSKGKAFAWDLIFPGRLYRKVAKVVGLPLKRKNPDRQIQGQKLAKVGQCYQFSG